MKICLLCGLEHPPKFFCYTPRQFPDDNNKIIKTAAPRFFCENNFKLRKETNEPHQYTITLLPPFLHSYCRKNINNVMDAYEKYVNHNVANYQQAAIIMNAENELTFKKYYYRIFSRITNWILALAILITALNKSAQWKRKANINKTDNRNKLLLFKNLVNEYCAELQKLPSDAKFILFETDYLQYSLAVISKNNPGLGP